MTDIRSRRRRRKAASLNQMGRHGGPDVFAGGGPYAANAPTLAIDRNLLTNGKFSAAAAGWTATSSSLSIVTDGQVGDALRITNIGAASGYASQQVTAVAGTYRLTLYYKDGTAPCKVTVSSAKGGSDIASQTVTNANWTALTITYTTAVANPWVNVFADDLTAAHTAFFDEIFLVPVE